MASHPSPVSDDSSAGISLDNWWDKAPPKKSRTSQGAKNKLPNTSLHGERCLLTGETGPSSALERCHLVDRSISDTQRCHLQYAWGRKFDIDNRWNLFYLTSTMHEAFDAHLGSHGRVGPGWALVPEAELVEDIYTKIVSERDRRQQDGIKGPWPDFRSESWFPTRKGGYKYIFVPLTLKDEKVAIARHEWLEDTPSSPITIQLYYPPSYEHFPLLDCHVHPYLVIMNAYPKLKDNMDKLPPNILPMMGQLGFIYTTWEKAWQDANSPPLRTPGTTSRGSSQTGTHARRPSIGQSGLRSKLHMVTGERTASQGDAPPSGSSSGGQNECEELFDTSYGYSCSPLSVVTSHDLIPCQGGTTVHADPFPCPRTEGLSEDDQYERMPNNFIEWILGVETARERNQLAAIRNDSPDLESYATEEARAPPTDDWHSWTSEYAPWYVLLPKNKGLLSSNDWVEVKNYPPLTRALGQDE